MSSHTPQRLDAGYRRYVLRAGSYSLIFRSRSIATALVLIFVIAPLGILSLGLGDYPLSPRAVIEALLGGGNPLDQTVVFQWRGARTLAAILLGGILAIAGALFQSVTSNPLASPDLLGLSNGAFTGMLLSVVFWSASWPITAIGAVAGGLATALVIWTLAYRSGVTGFRLIVIGIGIAAILASANTWMLLQVELDTAMFASAWGAGSLNGVTSGPLTGAVLVAIPLVAFVFVLASRLRQLDLGDDVALATGARPSIVRSFALLAAVGLVSVATAVIGPVAFIALAAPQIARRLAGTPYLSLGISALVGSLLLLGSDLIAQHLLPVSLPVGVVTVSVGGLYLVFIMIQEARHRG